MSRTGRVTLFFGDAEHDFRIGLGEAEELDETREAGLLVLLDRVSSLRMADVRAVLRVGLTGGGMAKEAAARLVSRHLVEGYFLEAASTAASVIEAAIRGAPLDPPGEPVGEGTTPTPSPTAG